VGRKTILMFICGRLQSKGVEFGYRFGESVFRYMEDKSIPLSLIQNGLIPWVERFYQERVEHNDQKDEYDNRSG
jgi:hypothetical protein